MEQAGGARGADAGAGVRRGRRCWRGVHKICPAFAGAGGSGPENGFVPHSSVPGSEPGTGLAQAIETSNANYERNKTHDISGGPSTGRALTGGRICLAAIPDEGTSGCGVIRTSNALYLLGKDPSLAEVGRRYEISGAMAGGGAWGRTPTAHAGAGSNTACSTRNTPTRTPWSARGGRRRCDDRFDLEPKGYDFLRVSYIRGAEGERRIDGLQSI